MNSLRFTKGTKIEYWLHHLDQHIKGEIVMVRHGNSQPYVIQWSNIPRLYYYNEPDVNYFVDSNIWEMDIPSNFDDDLFEI